MEDKSKSIKRLNIAVFTIAGIIFLSLLYMFVSAWMRDVMQYYNFESIFLGSILLVVSLCFPLIVITYFLKKPGVPKYKAIWEGLLVGSLLSAGYNLVIDLSLFKIVLNIGEGCGEICGVENIFFGAISLIYFVIGVIKKSRSRL